MNDAVRAAGLDPHAPVVAAADVMIAAPAEDVWAVLTKIEDWSSWYPDLRDVKAPPIVEVGTRFTFKTGPVTIDAVVDVLEVESLIRFTGTSRGSTAVYVFSLSEMGPATEVSAAQTMSGLAAKTMRGMLQKIADSSLPSWLDALREQVETA